MKAEKRYLRTIGLITAFFIVTLFLVVGRVLPAAAAENLGITINSITGQVGSQVSVNVDLNNVAASTAGSNGLYNTNFTITYDPNVLQVAKVASGSLFTNPSDLSSNLSTEGKIVFLSLDGTGGDNLVKTDGVYATVTFNILATAPEGDTTIGFAASPLQAYALTSDYVQNPLRISTTQGKVTVTGSTQDDPIIYPAKSNVPTDKTWTIRFSEELDPSMQLANYITITDSQNMNVDVSRAFGDDGKSILVYPPQGGYTSGETYTLNIAKGLVSKTKVIMSKSFKMQFLVCTST